jgi:hypothetical protein
MITAYAQSIAGDVVTIEVTSDLVGDVFYHWYVDGTYFLSTTANTCGVRLEPGEPARVECVDTLDEDFDPIAGTPLAFPARRTRFWLRSPDSDVEYYELEEQIDGGEWVLVERIGHQQFAWSYTHLSGRLLDGSSYAWRIKPVDRTGNVGTPAVIAAEEIVRTPDPPAFAVAFDPETQRITFSLEAAA